MEGRVETGHEVHMVIQSSLTGVALQQGITAAILRRNQMESGAIPRIHISRGNFALYHAAVSVKVGLSISAYIYCFIRNINKYIIKILKKMANNVALPTKVVFEVIFIDFQLLSPFLYTFSFMFVHMVVLEFTVLFNTTNQLISY